MKKIRFYEITREVIRDAKNLNWMPDKKDLNFEIIIEEPDIEYIRISNETVKEKILKGKKSSYFYIKVVNDETNDDAFAVHLIDDNSIIEINLNADGVGYLSNPISGIEKFQADRLLDKQPFDFRTEVLNILEELVEMTGKESEAARKTAEEIFDNHFKDKLIADKEELVDCFTDIRVFSIGATMKLGYEPKCALAEVAKEINSRSGKIVDGKFTKDKSPEARAKWYKADFTKCGPYKQVKEI